MSGHNKWSKIKHKKAVEDAKKSKEFSKFAHLIALESKKAKGDVNSPGLRTAIDRARSINMPSSNIERAVKKGIGSSAKMLEEVTYEAYGPGGSAIILYGFTDNKNRTNSEVKHILSSHGTGLSEIGSASWAFKKEGSKWIPQTLVSLEQSEKEKLQLLIGALEEHDDIQDIYTNVE